jgi:uncharacterized membrane-anchored protein
MKENIRESIFSMFLLFKKPQHPDRLFIPDYMSLNWNVLHAVRDSRHEGQYL